MPGEHARIMVSGADRSGIVAAVSRVLNEQGGNITALDQHSTDAEGGRFFQRAEFHLPELSERRAALEAALEHTLRPLNMTWRLAEAGSRARVAILASRADHCLMDLLWREQRGELATETTMVISNHTDLAAQVGNFGVPFHHVPVTRETKAEAEAAQLELLRGQVDLVVLARYMQILSGNFLQAVGVPVINIHHSFLPAFMGAGPYQRAKERGVKLIGATAHYVTEDLDEGPIIEQDVERVTHAYSATDLARTGADIERRVLARAVAWHAEDRVFVDGNRTVVFA
ncbi:formyltetrahydrofolate deformylase [Bogoriella caseilytica]|uniref:Formyltetrahydrofolate deformylase n=1 Tax=Bogoriella caseilytica TaxID=56055 RepID=A0A3N2BDJ4_9MICO|nr:formyltetrahydrofolate deformylase [Bogoriella caseilytica]